MTNKNQQNSDVYSENDPLDINELASLNDDISPEFIEQLQNQVSLNAQEFTGKPISLETDDTELFEEVGTTSNNTFDRKKFEDNIDDNFIKKYKAKLNKQKTAQDELQKEAEKEFEKEREKQLEAEKEAERKRQLEAEKEAEREREKIKKENESPVSLQSNETENITAIENIEVAPTEVLAKIEVQNKTTKNNAKKVTEDNEDIKNITNGNILEKPLEQEQINYNESLDYLDDNVKYSKYVIYINPENKEFIDSLTVKERKNLINRIIREQDDIAITKKRLGLIHTIIRHSIVAIITIAIAIPATYWTINASLEASINNYRRSQTIFKTLYKEKGKIKTQKSY